MFYCRNEVSPADSRPRRAVRSGASTLWIGGAGGGWDWLDQAEGIDGPGSELRTTITEEHPKTIINFNTSPDIPFDRSINAYRGCEHGTNILNF